MACKESRAEAGSPSQVDVNDSIKNVVDFFCENGQEYSPGEDLDLYTYTFLWLFLLLATQKVAVF